MGYAVTIERKPTYVHAVGTGPRSPENTRQFLIDARRACADANCGALLLEMRFSGPSLDMGSIYSVIAERSPSGSTLERIAYVDASAEYNPEASKFAELVAQNRGVNVRLFRNLEEAKEWLQASTATSSDPHKPLLPPRPVDALPADIQKRIERDFGASAAHALHRLKDFTARHRTSSDEQVDNRVIRCILHLAAGSTERIEHYIEAALRDWRDVILWAEYDKDSVRVRDYNNPFSND